MKKIIIIFFIFVFFNKLLAFNPLSGNFADDYQYQLFRSWIDFGQFPSDNPAFMSKNEIISSYHNSKKDSVTIIFSMKKELIIGMSEMFQNPFPKNKDWLEYQNEIGMFLFRLNTDSPNYLIDLMKDKKFSIQFQGLKSRDALLKIKTVQKKSVVHLKNILIEDSLKPKVTLKTNIGVIELFLNKSPDLILETSMKKQRNFSAKKEIKTRKIQVPKKQVQTKKMSSGMFNDLQDKDLIGLEKYIIEHKNDKIYNQIMNNRIKDLKNFVKDNFKINEEINFVEDKIIIRRKRFKDFSADLVFRFEKDDDGYYLYPDNEFKMQGNNLIIDKDRVKFFQVEQAEINKIIPAISEMILLHRTIGTKLFNFLIHNDQANTLLILNGKKRKTFHFRNYATLLLLLNQYWENRVVYYKILSVKKVNNNIEIESALISQNQAISDFASIKMQLNHNFKVDLIQVSLFPEIKN